MNINQRQSLCFGFSNPDKKIFWIVLIMLFGLGASLIYHYLNFARGYPYNTFLFAPNARFSDFTDVVKAAKNLNPYYDYDSIFANYFPFTYVLAYVFSFLDMSLAHSLFIMIFLSSVLLYMFKMTRRNFIGTGIRDILCLMMVTFFSYPMLFELDRSNFEAFTFIFVCLFVVLLLGERYVLSSLFLALAIAMKGYPIAFAVLYLDKKKYKYAVLAGVFAVLICLFSFAIFRGGVMRNVDGLKHGFDIFKTVYLSDCGAGSQGIKMNASLLGTLRYFYNNGQKKTEFFIKKYFPICIGIFLLVSVYIVFIEKTFWKKTFLVTCLTILLPHISFAYKLILLFLPLGLFIYSDDAEKHSLFFCGVFGLLLAPKNYYLLFPDLSINEMLNQIIMGFAILFVMYTGVRKYLNLNPGYLKLGK